MRQMGTSLTGVKELNRLQIKRVIYFYAPVTRQRIAEELGLTLPTITTNIAGMLEEGLLTEFDAIEKPVSPSGGRPPLLLDFQPQNILGIELGPNKTFFCVTDLRGKTIYNEEHQKVPLYYDAMLDYISKQILNISRKENLPSIQGIGVGLPGIIESTTGIIRNSLYSTWEGKSLVSDLSGRTGLTVYIDNNVRLRALGREMFSRNNSAGIFAYLYISRGIACQLIIKNDLLDGNISGAGEIGHTTILPGGPLCPVCGRKGCLEAVAGEGAILDTAQSLLDNGKAAILSGLLGRKESLTIDHILKAQKKGDADVCAIVEKAVEFLALATANIFNFISPANITVDGYIFSNEANRILMQDTVRKNLYGLANNKAKIEFLNSDPYLGAKGAAALVIRRQLLE